MIAYVVIGAIAALTLFNLAWCARRREIGKLFRLYVDVHRNPFERTDR